MKYDVVEESKRLDYLDLAKGFLIITVVLSHSEFNNAMYLYWFHMPAFFIISGLLAKEKISVKDQFIKFFLPYMTFSIVDLLISYIGSYTYFSLGGFASDMYKYIYSGKAVGGVFWFVPCLFLSKVIFNKLKNHLGTKELFIVIVALYCLAHVYSQEVMYFDIEEIPNYLKLPWDIDVLLITIPYYAIGYFFKRFTRIIQSKYTFIITLAATIFFFYSDYVHGNYYYLNIKFSKFTYPVLDLIVPVTITLCILSFSALMVDKEFFDPITYIGKISLVIMYFHKPICSFLSDYVDLNFIEFTLTGVIVPALTYKIILCRSILLEKLFLGKQLIRVK